MKKKVSGLIVLVIGLFAAYSLYNGKIAVGIVSLVGLVLVGIYLLGISEEKKEVAGIEIEVEDNECNAFLSPDAKLDIEQVRRIRDEFLKNCSPDDVCLEINAACDLMLNKDYIACIQAYERIMEKYPEDKRDCLDQIGVAEFYLGNYEKALEKYIEARSFDEGNSRIEENIWEVCEVIYKKDNNKESIEKYISLYPHGRYIKKSKKTCFLSFCKI